MSIPISSLWWRWLLLVCLIGVLFGALIVAAPPTLFRPINRTVYNRFFGEDRYGELSIEEVAFQKWLYGVLGATMAGWCLTVAFIAYFPFRAGERWAWWALCVAIVVWYLLDTGISWWHGVLFNVIFNSVLLVAFGVPLVACSRAFLRGEKKHPIPDTYWIRPGQMLAGEYPGAIDEARSRQRLGWLLEAGATFFLDLTRRGEQPDYADLLQKEAAGRGYQVEYRRMGFRNATTPSPEEMVRILDTIDAALAAGHVVYVHCVAGVGRTGVVVGCYLVRHGLSGEEALKEMAHLRQGIPRGRRPSPFRKRQWQMVLNWSEEK